MLWNTGQYFGEAEVFSSTTKTRTPVLQASYLVIKSHEISNAAENNHSLLGVKYHPGKFPFLDQKANSSFS